jgi:hypothetical protein
MAFIELEYHTFGIYIVKCVMLLARIISTSDCY